MLLWLSLFSIGSFCEVRRADTDFLTTWKRKLSSYSKGIKIAENLKDLAGINSVLLSQRIIIKKKKRKK